MACSFCLALPLPVRRFLDGDWSRIRRNVLRGALLPALVVGSSTCEASKDGLGPVSATSPKVSFYCQPGSHATVQPVAMWLPSDTAVGDTIVIALSGPFEPDHEIGTGGREGDRADSQTCEYEILDFGEGTGAPLLLGITERVDTLFLELGASGDGRTRIEIDMDGQLVGSVDVLMASRDLAHFSIGHRGAGGGYAENTIGALRAAVGAGLTSSEVDVLLTRDTVPILIHDSDIDRTTNGRGPVDSFTLSDIRRFSVVHGPFRSDVGERIPTLAEAVVATRGTGHRLFLDLKRQTVLPVDDYGTLLVGLVRELQAESRVVLLSDNLALLSAIRAVSPEVVIGFIAQTPLPGHAAFVKRYHPAALLYRWEDLAKIPQVVGVLRALDEAGAELITSTVNDPVVARRILENTPVQWVLTDLPPLVFRCLRNAECLVPPK